MKVKFAIFLMFVAFAVQAKQQSATVYYLNGNSEKGFVKSFLEEDIIDFNFFGSFEKGLVYNDKSVKFYLTEDSEAKRISTDEIDKIVIHYEDFDKEYKALLIKKINKKGELIATNQRIFLPLIRAGKVNLYGFFHRETVTNPNGGGVQTFVEEIFYLQNAKENYAFDYNDYEVQDIFNIKARAANPLKELFKDCPELVQKVHDYVYMENIPKGERKKITKEQTDQMMALQKEYEKIVKETKKKDLLLFHKHHYYFVDEMILQYNNCENN